VRGTMQPVMGDSPEKKTIRFGDTNDSIQFSTTNFSLLILNFDRAHLWSP